MMKNNEDNEGISFLFVIQFFSFRLVIGGLIAAIMIGSISYSTKHSGAYERYDLMETEISSITFPEKTIYQSSHKGVRSTWVYISKSYKTDYPYNKIIADCRQQLKLKGWKELRKKWIVIRYYYYYLFFQKKGLEIGVFSLPTYKSPPFFNTYSIDIEWRK